MKVSRGLWMRVRAWLEERESRELRLTISSPSTSPPVEVVRQEESERCDLFYMPRHLAISSHTFHHPPPQFLVLESFPQLRSDLSRHNVRGLY